MAFQTLRHTFLFAGMCTASGCAIDNPAAPHVVTTFSDISDTKFTIKADAPPAMIREVAICKAVWLTGRLHKTGLSMTNPVYSEPTPIEVIAVPPGWIRLAATAYLAGTNPDGNPVFQVADWEPRCRAFFPDWAW